MVAENVVRPDTIGAREMVNAKYELLPRGQYTMNLQAAQLRSMEGGEKLPYDRYEAVLELYQAENAVQIARSLGADRYAPESIGKATTLLTQAEDMNARRMDTHAVVSAAREAAQMAEDARTISVRRRDEDRIHEQVQQSQNQGELRRRAEEDAAQARADAQAEAQQAAQAREDAAAAEAQARLAQQAAQQAALTPLPPPPVRTAPVQTAPAATPDTSRMQFRARLLAQLNGTFATRDTPRGLVLTVTNSMFDGDDLRFETGQRLANVAAVLASHPELSVRVEGYAEGPGALTGTGTSGAGCAGGTRSASWLSGRYWIRRLPANRIQCNRGWARTKPPRRSSGQRP